MPDLRVTPVWLRLAYSIEGLSKRGHARALLLARELCDSNDLMVDVCNLERRGNVSSYADNAFEFGP
jgi:hypothetical protein